MRRSAHSLLAANCVVLFSGPDVVTSGLCNDTENAPTTFSDQAPDRVWSYCSQTVPLEVISLRMVAKFEVWQPRLLRATCSLSAVAHKTEVLPCREARVSVLQSLVFSIVCGVTLCVSEQLDPLSIIYITLLEDGEEGREHQKQQCPYFRPMSNVHLRGCELTEPGQLARVANRDRSLY